MKTQTSVLFQPICKDELKSLTKVTSETLDVPKKPATNFTSAELYRIRKQRRTFQTRRFLFA